MTEYVTLDIATRRGILTQQLASIEEQHYRATITLALAEATGQPEAIAGAQKTITGGAEAIAVLRALLQELGPPGPDELDAAGRAQVDRRAARRIARAQAAPA